MDLRGEFLAGLFDVRRKFQFGLQDLRGIDSGHMLDHVCRSGNKAVGTEHLGFG